MGHPSITISVQTQYIASQSEPDNHHFVFAYTISIHIDGNEAVQLKSRHWLITNGNGEEEEVRGIGVVGEQPYIKPGESYEYTSGAVLDTPFGIMRGSYQMESESGREFNADIPTFQLVKPGTLQ